MTDVETALDVAGSESLIRSFSVVNLYGYRTVSLDSEYAATLIIAKNGSGKTTLVGAMNAFLNRLFGRLRDLQFDAIKCTIRGINDEMVLLRSDLDELLSTDVDSLFSSVRKWEIDPRSFLNFLVDDFPLLRGDRAIITEHPILTAIYRGLGYRSNEVINTCDKLLQLLLDYHPKIRWIYNELDNTLRDIEILYLPTYRRVEVPLVDKEAGIRKGRRKRIMSGHGLFVGDIQFGLSDISDHLRFINEEILFESNRGYRTISANIINELMDGTFDKFTTEGAEIPTEDELMLFLSRLKDGRESRIFPNAYDISTPNIANLTPDQNKPSSKFLIYFLSKLNKVIDVTREKEAKVQEFVDNCNKYLSLQDLSTSAPLDDRDTKDKAVDSKSLHLNRRNLKLHVESAPWGRKIQLDALSSGEKQMISLFAKLYLYPKKKVLLIDEPELSLSLDWQRQILVDVLRSPYCRQIVAITHSPFIFDNELEPYARALRVSVDEQALSHLGEDFDSEADADLGE